ncbi:unnamed protein product, partial [marine sediment metagenome]
MEIRLIPEEVEPVEGHYIKDFYSVTSGHTVGPVSDYDLITKVPLDTLDLLPGTYSVQNRYNILSFGSYRYAEPDIYEIIIGKDKLKALPYEDFNLGVEYGACYTIKQNNSWNIIFSGKIVN